MFLGYLVVDLSHDLGNKCCSHFCHTTQPMSPAIFIPQWNVYYLTLILRNQHAHTAPYTKQHHQLKSSMIPTLMIPCPLPLLVNQNMAPDSAVQKPNFEIISTEEFPQLVRLRSHVFFPIIGFCVTGDSNYNHAEIVCKMSQLGHQSRRE